MTDIIPVDTKINILHFTMYVKLSFFETSYVLNIAVRVKYQKQKQNIDLYEEFPFSFESDESIFQNHINLRGNEIKSVEIYIFEKEQKPEDYYILKVEMAGIYNDQQVFTYPDPIPQTMKLIPCHKCNKKRY